MGKGKTGLALLERKSKKRDQFGRTESARHRAIALQGQRDFAHLGDSRLAEAQSYWEVMDELARMCASYLHSINLKERQEGVAMQKFINKRSHQ